MEVGDTTAWSRDEDGGRVYLPAVVIDHIHAPSGGMDVDTC